MEIRIPQADFAPGSRLAETARTGVADSAQVVNLRGKTKININLPIERKTKVIGAVGRIQFLSLDQVEKLVRIMVWMELSTEPGSYSQTIRIVIILTLNNEIFDTLHKNSIIK